jgi:hypothetical protein
MNVEATRSAAVNNQCHVSIAIAAPYANSKTPIINIKRPRIMTFTIEWEIAADALPRSSAP